MTYQISYLATIGGCAMRMFTSSGPDGGYNCANCMGYFEGGGDITGNLNAIEGYKKLGKGYCIDSDGS